MPRTLEPPFGPESSPSPPRGAVRPGSRARGSVWLLGLALCGAACGEPAAGSVQAEEEGAPAAVPPSALPEWASTPVDHQGPYLAVKDTHHEFAPIFEGGRLEHRFHLASAGTAPLTVVNIKPSCGCTVAETLVAGEGEVLETYDMGTPLDPGQRLVVVARVDTRGRRGHWDGNLRVYCDDPRTRVDLNMSARLLSFLRAESEALRFGELSEDASAVLETRVSTEDGEPVLLYELDPERLPEVEVRLDPEDPDAAGRSARWRVTVTLGGVPERGFYREAILIACDREDPNAVPTDDGTPAPIHTEIVVDALIVGPLSVSASELSFGSIRGRALASRSVSVRSHDPDFALEEPAVRLLGEGDEPFVHADGAQVTVRRSRRDPGAWDVELLLSDLSVEGPGAFRGRLLIDAGHPTEPPFEVAIHGVVVP